MRRRGHQDPEMAAALQFGLVCVGVRRRYRRGPGPRYQQEVRAWLHKNTSPQPQRQMQQDAAAVLSAEGAFTRIRMNFELNSLIFARQKKGSFVHTLCRRDCRECVQFSHRLQGNYQLNGSISSWPIHTGPVYYSVYLILTVRSRLGP
jgi:hypothetical protein